VVELAARQELPIAQYEMGLSYRNGQIVAKNESIANQWFQLARANDFTESQYLAGFSYIDIDISIDFPNFASPQDSIAYRSTATARATLVKEGRLVPITAPVRWEATVVNPKAPWWLRGPNDLNGLSWVKNPSDTSRKGNNAWENAVMGEPPTTGLAKLMDVVGQRDVTLKAMATIDGIDYTGKVRFSFGKGPLSEFTSAPVKAQFAISADYTKFLDLESITVDYFPAIGQICHGSFEDLINYLKLLSTAEYDEFTDMSSLTKSNIPSRDQFHRLYFNNAGTAANWPDGTYWINSVHVKNYSHDMRAETTGAYFSSNMEVKHYAVCVDNSQEPAFGEPAKPAPASLPWPY
jgi:hypothetical protein